MLRVMLWVADGWILEDAVSLSMARGSYTRIGLIGCNGLQWLALHARHGLVQCGAASTSGASGGDGMAACSVLQRLACMTMTGSVWDIVGNRWHINMMALPSTDGGALW